MGLNELKSLDPNLTQKLCAWILSRFCSVPVDKRKAKIGQGAFYFLRLGRKSFLISVCFANEGEKQEDNMLAQCYYL